MEPDFTPADYADAVYDLRERNQLHRIMCTWWWRARDARLWRDLEMTRKAAVTRWRAKVVEQLESAQRVHDSRGSWECARALAGTGLGARRRWRGSCRGECPTITDSERHLSEIGERGGQSAYTLWTGDAGAVDTILSIGQQLYEPPCADLQAQEEICA